MSLLTGSFLILSIMPAILFKMVFLMYSLIFVLFFDLKAAMERLTLLKKVVLTSLDTPVSKAFLLLSIVLTFATRSLKLFLMQTY